MVKISNPKVVKFSELLDGDGFFFPTRNCHGIAVGRNPKFCKPHNAFLIYSKGECGFWFMEHNDDVILIGKPEITFNIDK